MYSVISSLRDSHEGVMENLANRFRGAGELNESPTSTLTAMTACSLWHLASASLISTP